MPGLEDAEPELPVDAQPAKAAASANAPSLNVMEYIDNDMVLLREWNE
jgi:hypothetical protein